ncbi:MAG: hypothetical protein JXB47_01545 [Anaerolineae bacterium]|nr:hypothetical protein [Anaerolineae bacterium]
MTDHPSLEALQEELNRLRAALPHLREIGAAVGPVEARIAWLEGQLAGRDDPDAPAPLSGLEPMLGGRHAGRKPAARSQTERRPPAERRRRARVAAVDAGEMPPAPATATAALQAELRAALPIPPGEPAPARSGSTDALRLAGSAALGSVIFYPAAGGMIEAVIVIIVLALRAAFAGDAGALIGDAGAFVRDAVPLWIGCGAICGGAAGAVGGWLGIADDPVFEAAAVAFFGAVFGAMAGGLLVLSGDPLVRVNDVTAIGGMGGLVVAVLYEWRLAHRAPHPHSG